MENDGNSIMTLVNIRLSKLALILIFICLAFVFLIYQSTHKLRVFVLHSYHPTMDWVMGLEAGLDQVFAKRRYINLRYFYMNTKHKHSSAYLKRIRREALAAIKQFDPDILIIFDTSAQKMIGTELAKKNKYKIVLAGVTDSDDLEKFEKAKNVTGVLEKIPVKAIREVLALMLPGKHRVVYLSDNSLSAKQLQKEVIAQDWGRFELVNHVATNSIARWKKAVLEAQDNADVILISTYQNLGEQQKGASSKQGIVWTLKNSKIPVIGLYESFINDGGYLAISVASFEQGYTAAKIALFILEKKIAIDRIPFINSQMFQLQLRKRLALKHYPDIEIPVILEAFSKTKWQIDDVVKIPNNGKKQK